MGRVGRVYRKVRARVTGRPTNFSWVNEGKLAGCGLPASKRQVEWLRRRANVSVILSLTEDPLPKSWMGAGITAAHIAMKDHAPPDVQRLLQAADYLDSRLKDGSVVAVHCLAGKGRTGCVLAAYMIAHEGKTAVQALEFLRRTRPGSVERPQQERIFEFENHLRAVEKEEEGKQRTRTN